MIKNKKLNKKRISPSTVALIGAVIITLGGFFLLYNFIGEQRLYAYDYMNNLLSENEPEIYDVTTEELISSGEDTNEIAEEPKQVETETYLGYLEIPKIKFRRGFYNLDSSLNNVELNIEIIEGSSMPDVTGGNLIIAGHSGTGWKAFFRNLYKLELGDTLIITYNGLNYSYRITNIYQEPNTGTIAIRRDRTKTTVTLITCTKDDSSTQTIYIAELEGIK
ncbi:MAG TPA: sortase [Candidatus Onthousia faecavium]|nr:sortase [Candidatus Onthousia faecavium]